MTADKGFGQAPGVELVGVAEIARMMGVARQRVHELTRVHADFPVPVAELSAGRIWDRGDIESWMASRERSPKEALRSVVAGVAIIVPVGFFPDMRTVGDIVRDGESVAVDLRGIDMVQLRRCIDFISGAAYVAGGEVERVAERVYLVLPPKRKLTNRHRGELIAALTATGPSSALVWK